MLSNIIRPTLILNESTCKANIARMADKARDSGVIFRPHFKTHQSVEVGQWFRESGVEAITVSSASMAAEFAEAGWRDITIAFPVNIREMNLLSKLASDVSLNLLVDSLDAVEHLRTGLKATAGVFIEVDCGYGRSGLIAGITETIDSLIKRIDSSQNLIFKGFLTHSGNTYKAERIEEIREIYHHDIDQLRQLKKSYINDFPNIITSIGDTPACSIVDDLSKADEIRPGNFVYYDLMQYALGVCSINDIAASVACPVTGIYHERNELVIYGGAIHLSKESVMLPSLIFGLIVKYTEEGWTHPLPDTSLISLSQEHGIIKTSPEIIKTINNGDLLGVLPVHSCLTANLLKGQDINILST